MEKSKKLKIILGLFYLILVSSFLIFIFSNFSFNEVTSYKFIQLNRDYFFSLKEANLFFISMAFLILTIIWIFLLGFGSPVSLVAGFIFGKWLGVLLVALGLATGATLLYIFGNYFLKDMIKEKFLHKYKNLESKFKKNEFIFFLLYRSVAGIPFQIANLLPVLFNVSIRNYFLGTFLGIMPSLFILVSLGSGIESVIKNNDIAPSFSELLFSPGIYMPILGFIILILLTIIVKNFFYKN